MVFEDIIFSEPLITWAFFILAYAILGGGIKYIDDAFDEGTFSKNRALLFIPILAVFGTWVLSLSKESATILMAIVIAVLLKGKIDNIAHKIGFFVLITMLFFSGYFEFLWIPMVIIAFAGIIDEVGNDFVDRKNIYWQFAPLSKIIYYFFEYRFTMKLAVLGFSLFGAFEWVYFFAFISFDLAYALIMHYGSGLGHRQKFYYKIRNNNILGLHNEARGASKNSG